MEYLDSSITSIQINHLRMRSLLEHAYRTPQTLEVNGYGYDQQYELVPIME